MAERARRILLVEDDVAIREAVRELLEERGHHVLSTSSGAEALDLLRRARRPDVIVLDLTMPGVDGWQFRLAQLADRDLARIPVVLISASARTPEQASAMRVAGYLRKPFDASSLLALVEASGAAGLPH